MADAPPNPEHRAWSLGHGTSDQLQYYLHHRHDSEDNGNSGSWRAGVLWGAGDSYVSVYQTLYEKVVEKSAKKHRKVGKITNLV